MCREGKLISGRHGWRARLPRQELDQAVLHMHWLWDFGASVAHLDWSRLP
jgi:hypothetical protein